jgi:hypothetical protein
MSRYKKSLLSLAILISVAAVAYGLFCWYKPRRDFRHLLSGDDHVELSSLVLMNHTRNRITVEDHASIEYLAEAFRSAQQGFEQSGGGRVCAAEVHLSSGYTRCSILVPDDLKTLTVNFSDELVPDAPENYYVVRLPRPMPPQLAKALSELTK